MSNVHDTYIYSVSNYISYHLKSFFFFLTRIWRREEMELNKIEEKDNGRYMVHLSINGRCESRRNRNCLPITELFTWIGWKFGNWKHCQEWDKASIILPLVWECRSVARLMEMFTLIITFSTLIAHAWQLLFVAANLKALFKKKNLLQPLNCLLKCYFSIDGLFPSYCSTLGNSIGEWYCLSRLNSKKSITSSTGIWAKHRHST